MLKLRFSSAKSTGKVQRWAQAGFSWRGSVMPSDCCRQVWLCGLVLPHLGLKWSKTIAQSYEEWDAGAFEGTVCSSPSCIRELWDMESSMVVTAFKLYI